MTQLQLQNLIVNSLGPIVDEATRIAGPHAAVTTFPASAAQFAAWPHSQRLRYLIDRARNAGDLPPPVARPEQHGDDALPDSDWNTIVTT